MPTILQDKSKFSVVGLCITDPTGNSLMAKTKDDEIFFSDYGNSRAEGSTNAFAKNNCRSCSCLQLDGSLKRSSQPFIGKSNWVLLMFDSPKKHDAGIQGLPKLNHIHWNGQILSEYDVHVCKS